MFEGVVTNSISDHFTPHYDAESANARMQLRTEDPNTRAEYTNLYEEQLKNIIEGYDIYAGEEEPIPWTSTLAERIKVKQRQRKQGQHVKRVNGLFPPSSDASTYSNWKAV